MSRKVGGSICSICKHHIDCESDSDEEEKKIDVEIVGGSILTKAVGNAEAKAKKSASKAKKVAVEGAEKTKKAGKKVGKYTTNTDGLSSDLLNYGVPAVTSGLFGALGSLGGPVAGVAASALGSKLGVMASDKIADETVLENRTGEGIAMKPKRKAKFEKGSEEAKAYMAELRARRQKK